MAPDKMEPTRQEFLLAIAGAAALPRVSPAQTARGKMLIVVAHPDDESAFAASTYRLVRELGWIADQVTITDGASGYRYATLAETYYGVALTTGSDGHARLAAIRKEEALGAGKVLGIRQHYFLDQKDLGFERSAAAAETGNWDRAYIRGFLSALLTRERYDAVFALLPTQEAHAHHRAATLLALEAVANLPDGRRPLVFGAEPRSRSDAPLAFASPPAQPLARTTGAAPVVTFHRDSSFGYHGALNYQIVANWVIAEHKSQGLFQNDYSRHECEQFWLFEASGKDALERLPRFRALLQEPAHTAAARDRTAA